ncbi:cytochrome b5 [Xylona heveae TC161]|uniref:Cytochrome b5 n=1 Tax=Xylona heveae (strain CBS 132557 / TC161) TaxID=1328760 RepID=A0A165HWD4_XYLHT|nr:cytochrome b5 [Xylona heveae TC161]KZF24019.1 cytochrome b5 [Xylona heveae TC161]
MGTKFCTPRSPKSAATAAAEQRGEESESDPDLFFSNSKLSTFIDILRSLAGLVLLGGILSYFITSSSFSWGWRPAWTRTGPLKTMLFGPISLTPVELSLYNGTDPALPIYVAVNGSIYDVSASPRLYGPGGSYSFFAGRDAARAFVTGCFQEDLNADLRGVEEMFVPVDDERSEASGEATGKTKTMTPAQKKIQREREYRTARTKVRDAIQHWQRFFENNDKYWKIGNVLRDPNWLEHEPVKPLCEAAQRARPKRGTEKAGG